MKMQSVLSGMFILASLIAVVAGVWTAAVGILIGNTIARIIIDEEWA